MGTGLGWESANHYRNLLSKVFTVAKKWGYFSGANPIAGVELPEKVAVGEKQILTPEQVSRLMDVISEPVRTMVWLSLLTGLRIGEVLGLPWKNVAFSSRQIRITQAFYRGTIGSPKTKCSKRLVSIPTALRAVLTKLYESSKHEEEKLVFHTVNGTPYNDSNLLHRCLKTGRPKAWHAMAQLAHPAADSHHAISRPWEALCGTHRPSSVIPRCLPHSRSTPYRSPSSSALRSKNSRF